MKHESGLEIVFYGDLATPNSEINKRRREYPQSYVWTVIATGLRDVAGRVMNVDDITPIDDCPIFKAHGRTGEWVREASVMNHVVVTRKDAPSGHMTVAYPFLKGDETDWNTEMTLNYNGVNSYVEIPEWKPGGEFEIECDVYVSGNGIYAPLRTPSSTWAVYVHDYVNLKVDAKYTSLQINGVDSTITGDYVSNALNKGFNKLSLTGGVGIVITGIGCGQSDRNSFKGQISNLKLVDKENPENSRFYPGIVYSYVDPDATDVPMPDSTVLVDEWCAETELTSNISGTARVEDGWTYLPRTSAEDTGYLNIPVHSVGLYKIEFDAESTTGKSAFFSLRVVDFTSPSTNAFYVNGLNVGTWPGVGFVLATGGITGTSKVVLQCDNDSSSIRVKNIKVTKVTHGIMTNFGTTQPYVPLLGDREEYCGNNTNVHSKYIRGVRSFPKTLVSSGATEGSWGTQSSGIVDGSILTSNGIATVVGGNRDYGDWLPYTGEYSKELQRAFQYPNTFKVISQEDVDYNDYAPSDWVDFTPAYNGVNSYVEIPAWDAIGDWETSVNVKGHGMVLSGSGGQPYMEIRPDGQVHWRGLATINSTINLDITKVNHIHAFRDGGRVHLLLNGQAAGTVDAKSTNGGYNEIGKAFGSSTNFQGQISNLKLVDKVDPANSRFYEGILKGDPIGTVYPTSTQLTESLGAKCIAGTTSLVGGGSVTFKGNVLTSSGGASGVKFGIAAGTKVTVKMEGTSTGSAALYTGFPGGTRLTEETNGSFSWEETFTIPDEVSGVYLRHGKGGTTTLTKLCIEIDNTHGTMKNFGSKPWVLKK